MRRWHIRGAAGFYVGKVGQDWVWARRSFFAARYSDPDVARKWIRDDLEKTGAFLDELHVVRVVRRRRKRTATLLAPVKGGHA